MTPHRKDEIRRLLEEATPGPWRWIDTDSLVGDHGKRPVVLSPCVESLGQYAMIGTRAAGSGLLRRLYPDDPNAALIAAAPTALRELLAYCEELERAKDANVKAKWELADRLFKNEPRIPKSRLDALIDGCEGDIDLLKFKLKNYFQEEAAAKRGGG